MIKVDNVSRDYVSVNGFFRRTKEVKEAVKGITFNVKKGEIFGLLGPNGAGKTTTIKMLTTLLLPSKGSIEIFGLDIRKHQKEIQKKINFIYGGERSLYWRLTAKDNLAYFADLYNLDKNIMYKRINYLLNLVGLENYSDKRVETFSKGMKQRLQIARSLINSPEVLFMDEPTIGLDPAATSLLHEIIRDLRDQGKTIILTTHYMKEAEELCDRVAFINQGEIVAIESPEAHINGLNKDGSEGVKSLQDVYMHHFGDDRSVA